MDPWLLEGQGLVLPGHVATPTQARATAHAWLLDGGADPWDAEARTEAAPVNRAWWAGEDPGFVQEHHDGAQPVTVVQLHPRGAS